MVEEHPPKDADWPRVQVSAAHSYTQECCVRVKLMLTLTTMTIVSLVLGGYRAITCKLSAPIQHKQLLGRSAQESHQVKYNHQDNGLKSSGSRSGIVLTTSTKVTTQQAHSSECPPMTALRVGRPRGVKASSATSSHGVASSTAHSQTARNINLIVRLVMQVINCLLAVSTLVLQHKPSRAVRLVPHLK